MINKARAQYEEMINLASTDHNKPSESYLRSFQELILQPQVRVEL